MKKSIVLLSLITLSGAAFAQPTPSPSTPSAGPPATESVKQAAGPDFGEAASGEVIYFRYCAACHGRSLKGDGPVASGLRKAPIDLTQLTKKNNGTFPFDKVAAMIDGRQTTRMHGTPDMPVWGEIFEMTTGTEAPSAATAVKRITNFVWSHQEKPAPPEPRK